MKVGVLLRGDGGRTDTIEATLKKITVQANFVEAPADALYRAQPYALQLWHAYPEKLQELFRRHQYAKYLDVKFAHISPERRRQLQSE